MSEVPLYGSLLVRSRAPIRFAALGVPTTMPIPCANRPDLNFVLTKASGVAGTVPGDSTIDVPVSRSCLAPLPPPSALLLCGERLSQPSLCLCLLLLHMFLQP